VQACRTCYTCRGRHRGADRCSVQLRPRGTWPQGGKGANSAPRDVDSLGLFCTPSTRRQNFLAVPESHFALEMYGEKYYGAGYGQASRPRYRKSSFFTSFFLFAAFLLLLLVALSLPIIKAIYLLELKADSVQGVPTNLGTSIRFGVWGYCVNRYVCSVAMRPFR